MKFMALNDWLHLELSQIAGFEIQLHFYGEMRTDQCRNYRIFVILNCGKRLQEAEFDNRDDGGQNRAETRVKGLVKRVEEEQQ